MPRFVKKRSKKAGLPPGSLIHIGEFATEPVKITLTVYDENSFEERELKSIDEYLPEKEKSGVKWISIEGLQDTKLLERVGELFGLHPLVLEDIVNTDQRPKMEDFGDYLFVVLKSISGGNSNNRVSVDQFSLILGPDYVLSFQERKVDLFNSVKERLKTSKGRIRKRGADVLAYALIDTVVDHYFVVLEKIGEGVELLEEKILGDPTARSLSQIHQLKSDLIFLRKSVWPLREVIGILERGESPLFNEGTLVYLRDVYDHTIQVIDTIETFRDMSSSMLDIYLSSLSNRMNQVMKVLMIIATIFIPLTFLTGLYGMNFKYMPLIESRGGFYLVIFIMLLIDSAMLFYFKKKRWL